MKKQTEETAPNPKVTALVTETCTKCGRKTEVVFYSIGPAKGLICENCHEAEMLAPGVSMAAPIYGLDEVGRPIVEWVKIGEQSKKKFTTLLSRESYDRIVATLSRESYDNDVASILAPAPAADPVTRPSHYRQGKIECIDCIESAVTGLAGFEGMLTGNTIKYLFRWKFKNGLEDLKKAQWYLGRLIALVEGCGKDKA